MFELGDIIAPLLAQAGITPEKISYLYQRVTLAMDTLDDMDARLAKLEERYDTLLNNQIKIIELLTENKLTEMVNNGQDINSNSDLDP